MIALEKVFRLILSRLDMIVYQLLEWVYGLFLAISKAGIFSQAIIQSFASRIYVFLGLIMVFKVSISLVTYIMNPDNFSKGDVGAPALLKGFIFALVGIVLVPYAFEMAYSFQRVILKENVIGNLILGMNKNENSEFNEDYVENGAKNMGNTVTTAFYRPNEVLVGNKCIDKIGVCDDLVQYFEDEASGMSSKSPRAKYEKAYEENAPISKRFDLDIVNATTDKDGDTVFVMEYTYLITTFVGGFITYILLLFCIDIAVRSVKLCFLQLIAPIPLISKVDPKKGDKVFGNWLKECVSTYLDVFMRLIAIYFAIFIVSAISLTPYNMVDGGTFSGVTGVFVAIFIVIGTLNFARELPKLIGGIFGIDFKGMGGFTLNPAKKFGATPILGAMGGNLVRKTAAGLDAVHTNGGGFESFRNAWTKESANDKGFIADGRRYYEKLTPMATARRKSELEAKEKEIEHEGNKFAGEGIYEAIQKQNKAIDDYVSKNKEKVERAAAKENCTANEFINRMKDDKAAQKLFGGNSELQGAYKQLNMDKRNRDNKQSEYEQLKMKFDKGETNVTAEDVDKARVAAVKASSKYDKHSKEFNIMLAADSEASKTYSQYTLYDDNAALYSDPHSAADLVTYGNLSTTDVNNHVAERMVGGHPEDHNRSTTPPPPTGGGGGNPPMGGNPRL